MNKVLQELPAKGCRGYLIRGTDDSVFFRIYKEDHSFVDYELSHHDCEIEILDDSAALITTKTGCYLDYTSASMNIRS
jgi:hypothetical protein